jgi:epoxide hydrolase-like predicted phosphatase
VVGDFGGVLITSITTKVAELARRHDTTTSDLLNVLLGPQESGDHPWHRTERGEIAVAEIQDLLDPWAARAGIELAGDEIEVLLSPGYRVVEPMVDQVGALRRRGIGTALLTNTFAEFRPTMERDLDLTMFDHVVESFAVGARKPEREIYLATEQILGAGGPSIVYLDDFDHNLEPAVALGWQTIHVGDPLVALAQLASVLDG